MPRGRDTSRSRPRPTRASASLAAPLRIPASGLLALGEGKETLQLREPPAIPGSWIDVDGSVLIKDGAETWGLWRVGGHGKGDKAHRVYEFRLVGSQDHIAKWTYTRHEDGSANWKRMLEGHWRDHCPFGPATTAPDGSETWSINGRPHREDGPAKVGADGSYGWYTDGFPHRLGGEPAIVKKDGTREWWVMGDRHRDGGPAVEHPTDGSEQWWVGGERHRDDGPAMILPDRREYWHRGKTHRVDGPAIEHDDGTRQWWHDGLPHRVGGPAFIEPDGAQTWLVHGKVHNADGPAIVLADGTVLWYLEGEEISHIEWCRRTGRVVRPAALGEIPASISSAMNRR